MSYHPFQKILVTVDGSFHANLSARYSFAFAEAFSSKLFVATVLTKEMDEEEEKTVARSVEMLLDNARDSGIDAEGVILRGHVLTAIDRYVRDNKIDLVIASTRRPHRDRRLFARSVTSSLMSRLPCNVIGIKIAHPGRSIKPKKVLIPVIGDGYGDNVRADIAEAIVNKFGSKITLFHVVELAGLRIKSLENLEKDRLIMSAEKRIISLVNELTMRGASFTYKIVIGRNARDEIISEASHHKYDLMIVGATTRNVLKRLVSGNPVEEILRDTPCDVMLVHFK